MAIARGELWFAPNHRMADIDLDDPPALIAAFRDRILGFFLKPALHLRGMAEEESALFASALICAVTIESLARFDPTLRKSQNHIADWLHKNIPQFRQEIRGGNAATYFESRFRNGLAHNGYIASLGRLGNVDEVITIDGDVVTINPFLLVEEIADWLRRFENNLSESVDVRSFQHRMKELFKEEIDRARAESAA
jgi:hypothetical protein